MNEKTRSVAVRIATGCIILPAALALMWLPRCQIAFALFISSLACVGLYEYYGIVRARAISPETIGSILAGTLVTFSGYFHDAAATSLVLYGGCLLVAALHIVRGQHSVAGLASSVFGVLYVGWLASHILLMHRTPTVGPGMVTLLFVSVILTDTAAYAIGSLFGKHKLAPKVSPGKTWEGAIAGFVFALAGAMLIYALKQRTGWHGLPAWSVWTYLVAGAALSIAAQIGDLTESCLKRDAGVKDSGGLFPGHGGVLDRCDGFLFAAPVLYYMFVPILLKT